MIRLHEMFPRLYTALEGDDIVQRLERLNIEAHRRATAMLAQEGRARARDLVVQMSRAQERADFWQDVIERDHRAAHGGGDDAS